MFHELNCCFKCGSDRPDSPEGFIENMNIIAPDDDQPQDLLRVGITNNMGDIFDYVTDKYSMTMMYMAMQYALSYHYDIEKLPNLAVTEGEFINCYDNVVRLVDSLNPRSNRL